RVGGVLDDVEAGVGVTRLGEGEHRADVADRSQNPQATNPALFGDMFTDYAHAQAIRTADAKLVHGTAPVFVYLFSAPPAYHGTELPYLFRFGVEDALADQVSDTWLAFARHGDPCWLPKWPA